MSVHTPRAFNTNLLEAAHYSRRGLPLIATRPSLCSEEA